MPEITDRPANGFNRKVMVRHRLFPSYITPAWARFTEGADTVEIIHIRKDGDFGAVIETVNLNMIVRNV